MGYGNIRHNKILDYKYTINLQRKPYWQLVNLSCFLYGQLVFDLLIMYIQNSDSSLIVFIPWCTGHSYIYIIIRSKIVSLD